MDLVPVEYQVSLPTSEKTLKSQRGSTQTTLHGHSREKVIKTLKKHVVDGSIDSANFLTAELISSNGYLCFWDLIIEVVSENLMLLLTPQLAGWLIDEHRFLNSLRNKFHQNLCNQQEARNHFSQIVIILGISQKNKLTMPLKQVQIALDPKSKALAEEYILLSQVKGSESDRIQLETALSYFIYHINHQETKYSLYWIHQIVRLKDIKILPISIFKTPKSISDHPVWILWNFVFIRVSPKLKEYLDQLISLFILAMSRKKFEAAAYLIFSSLLILKYQKQIKWDGKIPLQNVSCIRTIGKINYCYKHLSEQLDNLEFITDH